MPVNVSAVLSMFLPFLPDSVLLVRGKASQGSLQNLWMKTTLLGPLHLAFQLKGPTRFPMRKRWRRREEAPSQRAFHMFPSIVWGTTSTPAPDVFTCPTAESYRYLEGDATNADIVIPLRMNIRSKLYIGYGRTQGSRRQAAVCTRIQAQSITKPQNQEAIY